jgi:hypothetical protein
MMNHPDTMLALLRQRQRDLIDEAAERRRVTRARQRRRP